MPTFLRDLDMESANITSVAASTVGIVLYTGILDLM